MGALDAVNLAFHSNMGPSRISPGEGRGRAGRCVYVRGVQQVEEGGGVYWDGEGLDKDREKVRGQ